MSTPSDIDVIEATAALKGMLGIGGGLPAPSSTAKEIKTKKTKAANIHVAAKQGNKGRLDTPKRGGSKQREQSESNPKSSAKSNNKVQQNFAWSAFQASPDASALPIPAFAAPAVDESSTRPDPNQLLSLLLKSGEQREEPLTNPMINAPRAEDLEAQQIAKAAASKTKGAAMPSLNSKPETEDATNPETLEEEVTPASESGINLATLADSPPDIPPFTPQSNTQRQQQQKQHEMVLPMPPTPFSSPQPNHHYSPHGNFNSPPPQPPQSYVTIQVQIPPILGPDRRMIVHSPAGYPVQVLIPDGVPPGMVIPVHVPTAPMILSPYFAQQPMPPLPPQQQQGFAHPHVRPYGGSPSLPYGGRHHTQQRPPN